MKQAFLKAAALFLVAALFTFSVPFVRGYCAQSYILMDGNTGAQLAGKNVHERTLIASTTKIMTALVALRLLDVNSIVVVPREAVGVEGSSMYLQEGESLQVLDLLYGLMLESGNDAAVALAIASCGSVEAFVSEMNDTARELGLQDTHFENPHGLDGKDHYSSAYDLGLLTIQGLKDPLFRQIVSRKEITVGNRVLRNHNRLLWMKDGIIGVKTGYTKAAGRILVSALEYEGRTLIAVTIKDGNDWQDHLSLYEYGKNLYSCRPIIKKDSLIGHFPTIQGQIAYVYADHDLSAFVRQEESPILDIRYPLVLMGHEGKAILDVYVGHLLLGRICARWEVKTNGTNSKTDCLPRSMLPP